MSNIVTVKDMCLWYGAHQALKDINIDIPDKRSDAFFGNVNVNILECLMSSVPKAHIFDSYYITHIIFLLLKYFSTSVAERFIIIDIIISIAAIANATPNSPCSFAYT